MEICSFGSPSVLDMVIVDFNVLEFKFTVLFFGLFLLFVFVYSCRSWLKASRSLSDLRCTALEHARVHMPFVPIYTNE